MWDDDWNPLDDSAHREQVALLAHLLGGGAKRILDIGAGDGRIARELAGAGHTIVALENDPDAIEQLRTIDGVETRSGDMHTDDWIAPGDAHSFDAVLLMGHTLLLVTDPARATALFRRLAGLVIPGGVLIADPDCEGTWRDIAEGNWQEGVSEDGQWQLIWKPGDNIVALRRGERVDPDTWSIKPDDRLMKLWTLSELDLLARATGWGPVESLEQGLITILNPGDSAG